MTKGRARSIRSQKAHISFDGFALQAATIKYDPFYQMEVQSEQ